MSERPILFSGEMVRAILDGRKSQTRRVITPPPPRWAAYWRQNEYQRDCWWMDDELKGRQGREINCRKFPYGASGDRLWVRESWWHCPQPRLQQEMVGFSDGVVKLRRGCTVLTTPAKEIIGWGPAWKHKPSIFMPRWASRITLEITKVRVERVQDISHKDALAEGCRGERWVESSPYIAGPHTDDGILPREEYRILWNHINAKRGFGWNKNPWVWVIEFKRVSGD